MKTRKWITCIFSMCTLAAMLFFFSGIPQTETAAAEGKYSIADRYETTAEEHIFKLNEISTDGYGVEEAYLNDGYVLLVMREYSEQGYMSESGMQHLLNSGRLVLFPIQEPDAAVSLEMDSLSGRRALLANGIVLAADWNGRYTIYNSELEEVLHEPAECGRFLGASDQGDLWFLTSDAAFVLYRDGVQIQSISVEGMRNGSYKGTSNGKAYFEMYNEYYGWTYAAIDLQDWSYNEIRLLYDYCDVYNGKISYPSADKWYLAELDDPLRVLAFTRQNPEETVWDLDDQYLISQIYEYDETIEDFHQDYYIYDMRSGGICDQKKNSELSEYRITMCDYEHGILLFEAHNDTQETKGLYLWDFSGMTASETAPVYETIDYHVNDSRVDELVQEIYDRYGVTVYYDAEHLKEYSSGYDLIECTDIERIGTVLVKLQECMAEYPEGFFEEIKGERISNVVFCLCDAHARVDMDTIEDAAATVATIEDTLRMSIDVHYLRDLRQIFLHENTHMMENRMEEEMGKITSRNYTEYWYREMNRPDCPPIQQYIWEQNEDSMKGVYDYDPENACYIDWYSKCTINEDHARILENQINPGSAYYFNAPYIDRKSRFLNAMIREAFPCVQDSGEVFWEHRTGIVDLYQEFPDFIVTK